MQSDTTDDHDDDSAAATVADDYFCADIRDNYDHVDTFWSYYDNRGTLRTFDNAADAFASASQHHPGEHDYHRTGTAEPDEG